jgi:hypothetical protein
MCKLLYGKYHLIAKKVTRGVVVVPMMTNGKPFGKKEII